MTNVNLDEVDHFDKHAHFWWDENGPFKTLHHINSTRLEYISSFINLKGLDVIDVGCGGGVLTEAMASKGAKTSGIDMSSGSINTAKMHMLDSGLNIDYKLVSVEQLAKTSKQSFDVVVCMEMLEHVPDPESIVKSCLELLKPNGLLFLSTINRSAKAMVNGIFMAEHVLKLIPKGTHHYDQLIKPSELHRSLINLKAKVLDISGLKYNPISEKSWVDKHDLSINYFITAQKSG